MGITPYLGPRAHLEVDGVHSQLVRVQVAQSRQGAWQVVQVVHGQSQCVGDLLAVGFHLCGAGAQVQLEEVSLGGGEGQEGPAGGTETEVLRPRAERLMSAEGAETCPHLSRASVV